MTPVLLARINYAGDLGYELWVAPEYQRELFDRIVAAGEPHGLRLFGMRALMSLRLEKSYGTWFREYRPIYTPLEGGITRYIKLDHEFIGRAAHEAEVAAGGPARRLVAFVVEPDPDDPADVIGDEPIWHDGAVVGWVTSGGYGHSRQAVDRAGLRADRAGDAGRTRRRRVRDRDHRESPAGAAPARAAVRPDRAPGCASDRGGRRGRPDRRRRLAGRVRGGDSVAVAILRGGEVPGRGGTLCLAGDCGNCLAEVDGVAYVRTCQTAARPGLRVARHPAGAMPPLPVVAATDLTATPLPADGRAPPPRGRRRGHRRRVERAGRGRRGGTGRQVGPRPRRARGRRGRRDLRRADDRGPDRARHAPRPSARDRRRDRRRRDPPGLSRATGWPGS